MIHCTLEPVSSADDLALRTWLGKGPVEILLKVIDSQVKHFQTKGLAAALESGDHNDKDLSAKALFLEAQKYDHCLQVLKEIAQQQEPHQIAKLS